MSSRRLLIAAALAVALTVGGCSGTPDTDSADTGNPQAAKGSRDERGTAASRKHDGEKAKPKPKRQPRAGTALAALGKLAVKGRAPKTGYDREQFGGDWASIDGCDMRQRILQRDLRRLIDEAGSDCEISSGILADRYTASKIIFHRGGASEVDIDHVVALSDAWQKGAQQWPYQRRVQFANDPLNLFASDAGANRSKGDSDAASWLPPSKAFRCDYVARQIAVKRRYRSWLTAAEKDAMAHVLAPCPGTKLPTAKRVRVPVSPPPGEHAEPEPDPVATPRAKDGGGGGDVPYVENCDAVRAAGRDPLVRGDGVYEANTHMDRDGDGMACE
jgi:Protein of unknown function (DUF1524)/Excalibur calcium-binding domain